jgi:hypothetical protein
MKIATGNFEPGLERNIMENLTYAAYLRDPAVREQIDADVGELRREAVRQFIVAPLVGLCKRIARHVRITPAQTSSPSFENRHGETA